MQRHRILLSLVLVVLLAACAGRLPRPAGGVGADSSIAAVERFLQLAADRNYLEMGWVFGTRAGPVLEDWPREEVEKRMHAMASVLRHDSYVIGPPEPVPGRLGRADSFRVIMQYGGRRSEVPFVAVRDSNGRWYVEQVDLEAVTNVR